MANDYKFWVRNKTDNGWINILTDTNIKISTTGAASGQFGSDLLDEVLLELKGLAGGGAPGYAGTPIHIINTDDVASSVDETGSFSTRGGAAFAKKVFIGDTLKVELTTDATSINDGALNVVGGVGIQKKLFVGDVIDVGSGGITTTGNVSSVDVIASGDISGVNATLTNINVSGNYTFNTNPAGNVIGNVIPVNNGAQFLGDSDNKWNTVYANTINADTVNSTSFAGSFTGSFNGNLTGNVSGNVAGNVTGNLDGNLIKSPTVTVTSNANSTAATNGALVVEGGLGVAMDTFIGGNLTVGGILDASGIAIGWSSIPETILPDTDNSYDLGSGTFQWKDGYFGGTVYGNVQGNVTGDLTGDLVSPVVTVTSNTGSTSSTTGALVVNGGVGIDENLYVGENLNVTGNFTIGGSFVAPSSSYGQVFVTGTTQSTNKDTGALIVTQGGMGVEGNINLGGALGVGTNTTVGGTLGVTGATTLSSTLEVTGTVDINNAVDIDITGGDFDVLTDGLIKLSGGSMDIDATSGGIDIDVVGGNFDVLTDGIVKLEGNTFDVDATNGFVLDSGTILDLNIVGDATLDSNSLTITTTTGSIFNGIVGINDSLTIGSDNTDTVTFNAKINSNVESFNNTQSFGATGDTFNEAYFSRFIAEGGNSSTSTLTGDIVASGGVGIGEDLHVGGLVNITGTSTVGGITTITNTTQSTDKDTGALVVEGGIGVEKNVFVGGQINVTGGLIGNVTGNVTGNLNGDVTGSLVGTSVTVQTATASLGIIGDLTKTSTVYVTNTTPSTSLGTGALVIQGGTAGPTLGAGLSVEGNAYIGGNLDVVYGFTLGGALVINDATQSNDKDTGALILANGGLGVEGNVNIGGTLGVVGNTTITGDLTVNGTTTTVNSTTVTTADNLIVINDGEVGAGVTLGFGGIEVDRGSLTNYQFLFNESDDTFRIGEVGSLQAVATREDDPVDFGLPFFNQSLYRFDTTNNMTWDTTNNIFGVSNVLVGWNNATDAQTLVSGYNYMVPSTVSGVTLPLSPVGGSTVKLTDRDGVWGSTPVTVNSNGSMIEGSVQNLVLNVPNVTFEMVYTTSIGWKII